jgi:hypothetical protein
MHRVFSYDSMLEVTSVDFNMREYRAFLRGCQSFLEAN